MDDPTVGAVYPNYERLGEISHELNEFNEFNPLNSFHSWLIPPSIAPGLVLLEREVIRQRVSRMEVLLISTDPIRGNIVLSFRQR